MILVTVASPIEAEPFLSLIQQEDDRIQLLITGVGPTETAFRLTRFLEQLEVMPAIIINSGVAGAYSCDTMSERAALLDLCLAEREVFGDFGVLLEQEYLYFDPAMAGEIELDFDQELIEKSIVKLAEAGFAAKKGVFITVNSASGTAVRGNMLQQRWNGLCENMEGAATARICNHYNLPLIELRAISNMVEDRDLSGWKLKEAAKKAALAVTTLSKALL